MVLIQTYGVPHCAGYTLYDVLEEFINEHGVAVINPDLMDSFNRIEGNWREYGTPTHEWKGVLHYRDHTGANLMLVVAELGAAHTVTLFREQTFKQPHNAPRHRNPLSFNYGKLIEN